MGIIMLKETNTIVIPICEYCKGHKESEQLLGDLYACIIIWTWSIIQISVLWYECYNGC